MIKIKVEGQIVSVQETQPLHSGSADVQKCNFTFDKSWERFSKSAVFRVGSATHTVLLDGDDCCVLPWELLTHRNAGKQMEVGVYGVSAQTEIMTSVWDTLGVIREGSEPGEDARNPVDGVYEQIMAKLQNIRETVGVYDDEMRVLVQRAETAALVAGESADRAVTDLEELEAMLEKYGGVPGEDGKSAYDYAVDGGYNGTEEMFAQKLVAESYTKTETDEKLETVRKVADTADRKIETLREAVSNFHSNIVMAVSGDTIAVADSSDMPLSGLNLFGKTAQDGTPSPDNPQELNSVGDGGSVCVSVLGKNLWSAGDATFTKSKDVILKNPLPPGTYTFSGTCVSDDPHYDSCRVRFISAQADGDNFAMLLQRNIRSQIVVTLYNKVSQIELSASTNGTTSVGYTATFSDIQIEKGDVLTQYEPYTEQTFSIDIQNGLPGIPVTSGGNYTDANGQQWLCDEVDLAAGVLTKRISSVDLGSFDWTIQLNDNGASYFRSTRSIENAAGDGIEIMLCDSYVVRNNRNALVNQSIAPYNAKSNTTICVMNSAYTDVAALKASLSGVKLLFTHNEPQSVDLSDKSAALAAFEVLHTNYPSTTVYNDGGAGMAMDYIADTKLYIDNKFAELAVAIVNNT